MMDFNPNFAHEEGVEASSVKEHEGLHQEGAAGATLADPVLGNGFSTSL